MNLFLILLSVFAAAPAFSGNRIVHYDDAQVTLVGSLDLQTFPGPPNYENISGGDEEERHFYLKLNAPIDVLTRSTKNSEDVDESEKNVKILQLVISEKDNILWKKFRDAGEGARVKIIGTLFHRFSGHHHSRVLFSVEKMELLKTESHF